MIKVEIKIHHIGAFNDICQQFGIFPHVRSAQSRFDEYERVYLCTFVDTICADWRTITQHILYQPENERVKYASVYYSLYSCGVLRLINHEYQTYAEWKHYHPGMSLDHKMPKSVFPELTFQVANWQPLPLQENINKRNRVLYKETSEYLTMVTNTAKKRLRTCN